MCVCVCVCTFSKEVKPVPVHDADFFTVMSNWLDHTFSLRSPFTRFVLQYNDHTSLFQLQINLQQGAHGHLDGVGHRRPIQVAV